MVDASRSAEAPIFVLIVVLAIAAIVWWLYRSKEPA